jgi:hypothetical protein
VVIGVSGSHDAAQDVMAPGKSVLERVRHLQRAAAKSGRPQAADGATCLGYAVRRDSGATILRVARGRRQTTPRSIAERMPLHVPAVTRRRWCQTTGAGHDPMVHASASHGLRHRSDVDSMRTSHAERRGVAHDAGLAPQAKRGLRQL